MKNIIKIIGIVIVLGFMVGCGQMNINPSDKEIALCNENPTSCNVGDEIVMENGNAQVKEISGTGPIKHTMSKILNSSNALPIIDKMQKETSGS